MHCGIYGHSTGISVHDGRGVAHSAGSVLYYAGSIGACAVAALPGTAAGKEEEANHHSQANGDAQLINRRLFNFDIHYGKIYKLTSFKWFQGK